LVEPFEMKTHPVMVTSASSLAFEVGDFVVLGVLGRWSEGKVLIEGLCERPTPPGSPLENRPMFDLPKPAQWVGCLTRPKSCSVQICGALALPTGKGHLRLLVSPAGGVAQPGGTKLSFLLPESELPTESLQVPGVSKRPNSVSPATLALVRGLVTANSKSVPIVVWDTTETSSHLLLVTDAGVMGAVSLPFGIDRIFSELRAALSLKLIGAAARLFFSDSFDFSDLGPRIVEATADALRGKVRELCSRCSVDSAEFLMTGLPTSHAWFSKALGKAVYLDSFELSLGDLAEASGARLGPGVNPDSSGIPYIGVITQLASALRPGVLPVAEWCESSSQTSSAEPAVDALFLPDDAPDEAVRFEAFRNQVPEVDSTAALPDLKRWTEQIAPHIEPVPEHNPEGAEATPSKPFAPVDENSEPEPRQAPISEVSPTVGQAVSPGTDTAAERERLFAAKVRELLAKEATAPQAPVDAPDRLSPKDANPLPVGTHQRLQSIEAARQVSTAIEDGSVDSEAELQPPFVPQPKRSRMLAAVVVALVVLILGAAAAYLFFFKGAETAALAPVSPGADSREVLEGVYAAGEPARLLFHTQPRSATVLLNGRILAWTPGRPLDVPSGSILISLEHPGFVTRTIPVEVAPGEMKSLGVVTLERATGSVRIAEVAPGVTVTLVPLEAPAGTLGIPEFTAASGQVLDGVPVATYRVTATRPGWRAYRSEIAVRAGEVAVVSPVFGGGLLSVTSSPSGAEVLVDGRLVGTTPLSRHEIPAGRFELLVQAQGYQTAESVLVMEEGGSHQVSFDLNRIGQVYATTQLTQQPQALLMTAPSAPAGLTESVRVVVSLIVDSTGRVRQPRILSSPSAEISRNVLEAVPNWRFQPGEVNGRVVDAVIEVPVVVTP
jgi:TonB family protein